MRETACKVVSANVLTFPARVASPAKKGAGRARKAQRSNVLPFTGKTIKNCDSNARLPGWKITMLEQLRKAVDELLRGEVTGLLLATTRELPTEEDDPTAKTVICGAFGTDLLLAARHADWIAKKAREEAKDSPVRWV